jgi:hypothetical protein
MAIVGIEQSLRKHNQVEEMGDPAGNDTKSQHLVLGNRQACVDIVRTAAVEIVATDGRGSKAVEELSTEERGTGPAIQAKHEKVPCTQPIPRRRSKKKVEKGTFLFDQEVEKGNIEYKLKLTG